MSAFIGSIILGIVLIVIGAANMKGNIASIHSYHRHQVSEQDKRPFGKKVGLGTIIVGCALIIFGIFSFIAEKKGNQIYGYVGNGILIAGLAVGLGLSFYAMIKYNKGIF